MKAKPPAKLENVNDEPNVAQSPLPRSGSVQQVAAGNSDKQHREQATGWRGSLPRSTGFRYRGGRHQPRVPELWTLAFTYEHLITNSCGCGSFRGFRAS